LLQDRAQPARTGLAGERPAGDRAQRELAHFELDAFHAKHFLVLLDQRVLRLDQDLDQRGIVEFLERGDDRQPADELGDQAELDQVFRLGLAQQDADVLAIVRARDLGAEADARLGGALADDLFQAVEGAAADEQYVGRVDLNEFLVRMLAPALRRNRGDRAFDQLQQRLLHAFTRNIARNRRVVALARDLVDLVDIDDAALRLVDVVVAFLQQLLDDVLDVLADVPGLGQRRRIGDDEGYVEQARQRLGQQRLAGPRRPDQQDVALGELDVVFLDAGLEPLVVVGDCNREDFLRELLADHVLVEDLADLVRRRQLVLVGTAGVGGRALFADDVVAEFDALVADEHRRPGDKLPHLMLAFAAEGTVKQLVAGRFFRHSPAFITLQPGAGSKRRPWGVYTVPGLSPALQHFIDQPVGQRLVRRQEIVPLGVLLDLSDRLAGVLGQQAIQPLAQAQDVLGMDRNIRCLALDAAQRLVDQDGRIGQREALALGPRRQQESPHARRHADAQRRYVRLDELHRVVDRHSGRNRSARRVDVKIDVLVGILRLEEQHLRDDQIRRGVVDRTDQEHHALLQQPRIDVVS